MNRLQKKCLIASSALHGLLLLVLLFGAALMPEKNAPAVSPITVVNLKDITDGPTHGGSPGPQASLPPLAPAILQPPTPPQPVRQPTPTPTLPDAPSFKPVKPKTAQADEFTPVQQHPPTRQVASNNQPSDAKDKQKAADRQRLANQISRGIGRLSGDLSKDTAVQISSGADGGEASANYRDIVFSVYTAAWNPPASLDDESATVVVSVTIARDGHVIRHEIIKPSGNAVMDKSIGNTLDNVLDIAPFPEGSKDTERTYSIKFNLSAKRSLG